MKKMRINTRSKIIVMVIAFIMAVPILSTGTAFAAGNYSDTTFTFVITGNEVSIHPPRAKVDKTSSYMKVTSIPSGRQMFAKVMACSSSSTTSRVNVGSPTYTFNTSNKGVGKYMTNYVKEKGYGYASIMATPDKATVYAVSGVWSPDSI